MRREIAQVLVSRGNRGSVAVAIGPNSMSKLGYVANRSYMAIYNGVHLLGSRGGRNSSEKNHEIGSQNRTSHSQAHKPAHRRMH